MGPNRFIFADKRKKDGLDPLFIRLARDDRGPSSKARYACRKYKSAGKLFFLALDSCGPAT